ncbi:hypothetical protein, partial [Pseudomonas aeruginosa]|uniref:hypothetical protein n=1 Tax=Pseudomonas aeruginosa TaxID=287 RepID=UPI001CD9D2B8
LNPLSRPITTFMAPHERLREPEFRKMTSSVGFLGKLGKQFTIETAGRGPTAFPYFWLKPRLM